MDEEVEEMLLSKVLLFASKYVVNGDRDKSGRFRLFDFESEEDSEDLEDIDREDWICLTPLLFLLDRENLSVFKFNGGDSFLNSDLSSCVWGNEERFVVMSKRYNSDEVNEEQFSGIKISNLQWCEDTGKRYPKNGNVTISSLLRGNDSIMEHFATFSKLKSLDTKLVHRKKDELSIVSLDWERCSNTLLCLEGTVFSDTKAEMQVVWRGMEELLFEVFNLSRLLLLLLQIIGPFLKSI